MHDGAAPLLNIRGSLVSIGPLTRSVTPLLHRWINDLATANLGGFPDPLEPWSAGRVEGFLDRASLDLQRVWFVIYENASMRPVGHMNLRDIDFRHGTAEFGISIGEPADRGKGYGTEATRLMLDYAFTGLGLQNVLLDTVAFNAGAVHAYEKAGFKMIGRRRQAVRAAGQTWDVILMDCVASDFISPVLSTVLGDERPQT